VTQTAEPLKDVVIRPEKPATLAFARFRRNRAAVAGAIVLAVLVIVAIFAAPIAMQSPYTVNLNLAHEGPTAAHILGTDLEGRDVWSRAVYATRTSLIIGIGTVVLATAVGVLLGSAAGFYRGWIDAVIMRITDIFLSFPVVIFLIVAGSILGHGTLKLVLLLSIVCWPTTTRLVRGQFLELRETDYVLAARSVGCSSPRIILRYLLPGSLGVIVVTATFNVAQVILIEASLSFLGVGVQPPTPSWGNMLTDAQSLSVLQSMPWLWLPPTILIFLTIVSINFVGDGLRDALDPRAGLIR
jgi:peptide/nickel transport system permease protein